MKTQLAVLGGGPGGYAAAFLAADLGMQVTLVDSEASLGGTCLLRGCIPSKALLHVARVIAETEELAEWGVDFPRPKIRLETLRAHKEQIIASLSAGLDQLARQRKVRVIQARGVLEGPRALRLQGPAKELAADDRLEFDQLILATGSRPAAPPALSIANPRVMDSSGALALADVPACLLVIGGGYIGLEMATVYARLGAKVTVVEMTSGLLPGADRDLVTPLKARLEKLLAGLHLGATVTSLADIGEAVEATIAGPGEPIRQRFDRVLIAVGRQPNTRGIGLENTKVQVSDRGVLLVDGRRQTAEPGIFAIGDAAGEPMLAHKASHEGKVAARAVAGGAGEFHPRAIPAVVFTDPEVAWAGLTEDSARASAIAYKAVRYPWAASGRARALGRSEGLTKLIVEEPTERILGVGIVGVGAGELIAEGVLAIETGQTVRQLGQAIHPHPTLSETLGFVAEMYLGTATEIYRPRRDSGRK